MDGPLIGSLNPLTVPSMLLYDSSLPSTVLPYSRHLLGDRMKKLLIAAAVAALSATGAQAADIAARPYTKAPPLAAAPYNWSGIYLGVNVGGAQTRWDGSFVLPPAATVGSRSTTGIVGGFIGAQYQWQWLVVGIEGQVATLFDNQFNGSLCTPPAACAGTGTYQTRFTDALYTGGGRVGVALDKWMPYFTGGYAATKLDYRGFNPAAPAFAVSSSNNRDGYYVGGGVDWAIYQNWIVGVEYRHYDFGTQTVFPVTPAGVQPAIEQNNVTAKIDSVTARLSYKFNWSGPVVAKY